MSENRATDLIQLARTLGRHPLRLALWNEGSVAFKQSSERFSVSRAGANLAEFGEADLIEFNLPAMREISETDSVDEDALSAAHIRATSHRASSDALLYSYLLGFDGVAFAAHTQPIEINHIVCSPRARQFADRRTLPGEIISSGASSLLVPYADPGLALAKEVKRKMVLWQDRHKNVPKVILLQNHGMIVLGATADEVRMTTDLTVKAAQVFTGAGMMGGPVFLTHSNVSQIETMKDL